MYFLAASFVMFLSSRLKDFYYSSRAYLHAVILLVRCCALIGRKGLCVCFLRSVVRVAFEFCQIYSLVALFVDYIDVVFHDVFLL